MKTCLRRFNIYLWLGALLCATGCSSFSEKDMSSVRLHMESNADGTAANGPVQVTRAKIQINVEKEPFLTEGDLSGATLVDTVGGFAIQLAFDAHGSILLDMATSSHKGARIAILTQFPKSKKVPIPLSRWVAAPLVTKRISNGLLVFTPDTTREEAERIVSGLNKVAAKAREDKLF